MKILMFAIASSYTPKLGYQENLLSKAFADKGHQVIIISENYCYENGIRLEKNEDTFYDGKVLVIRKKYFKFLNDFISGKVRYIRKIKNLLDDIKPDLIFHHGLATLSMLEINKYVKKNNMTYIVDSHEDYNNSATNFLSKYILHKTFYRFIIWLSDKYISKYYYVSTECKKFITEIYKVKNSKTKYLPLGYYDLEEISYQNRQKLRLKMGIKPDTIVFIHSGKLDVKKNTMSIIEAFSMNRSSRLKLFIIGKILDKKLEKEILYTISNDRRITFIPWLEQETLNEYIMISDVYLQPGTQSSTFHIGAKYGNLLVSSWNESYQDLYGDSIIYVSNKNDLNNLIVNLLKDNSILKKSNRSKEISINKLDYSKQVDLILKNYIRKNYE